MAKKQAVSKTQAVRDYLKAHPGAMSKEIAAALTKQGIKINAGPRRQHQDEDQQGSRHEEGGEETGSSRHRRTRRTRSRRKADEWRRHDHAGSGQEGRPDDQDAWRLPAHDRSAGGHQRVGRREEVQGFGGSDDGHGDGNEGRMLFRSERNLNRVELEAHPALACGVGLSCRSSTG